MTVCPVIIQYKPEYTLSVMQLEDTMSLSWEKTYFNLYALCFNEKSSSIELG